MNSAQSQAGNQEDYLKKFRAELSVVINQGRKLRKPLLPGGITHSEMFAMREIYEFMEQYPGKKGIYVTELARELGIALSAVSRILSGLEERKLIDRVVDVKNRRNTFVSLTTRGEEVWNCCVSMLNQMLDHVILGMGEADLKQLIVLSKHFFEMWEAEINKCKKEMIKSE